MEQNVLKAVLKFLEYQSWCKFQGKPESCPELTN
jgi:hypothetical protein